MLQIHTRLSARDRMARVIEVMDAVKLPDPERLVGTYPHQLSGGQRQRVMIAAALALEPALLIADEPTTALDVTTQAQILKLIKDIQQSHGTAVLFITHDFGVVAEIADRVVVMQNGEVVEQGETLPLLQDPQHAYTRMLISSVPSITPPARASKASAPVVLRPSAVQDLPQQRLLPEGPRGPRRPPSRPGRAARRDPGHRRRVRLRQVDRGALHRAPDRPDGRPDPDRRRGHRRPDRGQLRAHRRDVQIVFQDPYRSLNPRRTVGASIVEGPMNFGLAQAEALARRDLMTLVGSTPSRSTASRTSSPAASASGSASPARWPWSPRC